MGKSKSLPVSPTDITTSIRTAQPKRVLSAPHFQNRHYANDTRHQPENPKCQRFVWKTTGGFGCSKKVVSYDGSFCAHSLDIDKFHTHVQSWSTCQVVTLNTDASSACLLPVFKQNLSPFSRGLFHYRKSIDIVIRELFPVSTEGFRVPVLSQESVKLVKDMFGTPIIIGEGGYGSVFLAKMADKLVAVKAGRKANCCLSSIIHEAGVCWNLRDTNAIPRTRGLVDFSHGGERYQRFAIVSDFIGNEGTYCASDMIDIMNSDFVQRDEYDDEILSREEWIGMYIKIAQKLALIHDHGIVMGDLKMDNIVIGPEWEPYIIDLGLSVIGEKTMKVNLGHDNVDEYHEQHFYLDPAYLATGKLDFKCDIYSLGAMIYKLGDIIPESYIQLRMIALACQIKAREKRPSAWHVADMLRLCLVDNGASNKIYTSVCCCIL